MPLEFLNGEKVLNGPYSEQIDMPTAPPPPDEEIGPEPQVIREAVAGTGIINPLAFLSRVLSTRRREYHPTVGLDSNILADSE